MWNSILCNLSLNKLVFYYRACYIIFTFFPFRHSVDQNKVSVHPPAPSHSPSTVNSCLLWADIKNVGDWEQTCKITREKNWVWHLKEYPNVSKVTNVSVLVAFDMVCKPHKLVALLRRFQYALEDLTSLLLQRDLAMCVIKLLILWPPESYYAY